MPKVSSTLAELSLNNTEKLFEHLITAKSQLTLQLETFSISTKSLLISFFSLCLFFALVASDN